MDRRWRNLLLLVFIVAIIGGVYVLVSKPPTSVSFEQRIDAALQKYSLRKNDFDGSLLLDGASETPKLKTSESSIPLLKKDIEGLNAFAKNSQERELVAFYATAVSLSEQNYSIQKRFDSLAKELEGKDATALCAAFDRFSDLELEYNDYFIALTTLSFDISQYSEKYSLQEPFSIDLDSAREALEALSLIDEGYNTVCNEEALQ